MVLLAVACGRPSIEPSHTSGSASPEVEHRKGLCQPFPDRLIDTFIAAYGERDTAALSELVVTDGVTDLTAVAHAGRAEFEDVDDWATSGWEAHDQLDLVGYGAFAPTRDGFTMYLARRNDGLAAAGIPELSFLLAAETSGCTIDELETVGLVQARGEPCAFYESFRAHAAVAAEEPEGCLDGSGGYARFAHAAVWADDVMIVAGGSRGGEFRDPDVWTSGLRYQPDEGAWSTTDDHPSMGSVGARAAWTGDELIVWTSGARGSAAAHAYDPDADRWRSIPDWPFSREEVPAGAWSGTELILWGSTQYTDQPTEDGAIYDPTTEEWRPTGDAPIAGREGHSAVWTGDELIVWGGSNFRTDLVDGAAYDPSTEAWREIAASPLRPRTDHVAFWTGEEMLVWGGSSYSSAAASGGAYDPDSDTWRRVAEAPVEGRLGFAGVWTGDEMLVWGGYDYHDTLGDGAAYDPQHDRWRVLAPAPISPRCDHSATWTGTEMIVYGGMDACGTGGHIPFGDGAAYDPASDTWRRLIPS